MHLHISGQRQTGRTTLLVNHLAEYLRTTEGTKVAVAAPNRAMLQPVLEKISKVVPTEEVVRLRFITGTSEYRGFKPDAIYVDNIDMFQGPLGIDAPWFVSTREIR